MKNIVTSFCICFFLINCHNGQNIYNSKPHDNTISNSSKLQQSKRMLQNGIDFFAQGNQPTNWQLTINYDDTVRFNADDGLALKFAYNQLKKEFTADKTTYSVKIKAGNIVINILEKICTVSTIREVFKKEVTVSFNSFTYTGCGNFLADGNLNNKWLLEKIGNTLINIHEYNKIPFFEFDIIQSKISGNDGCNSIGGKIEVQGKRIKFSNLFSTRIACNKKSIDKIIAQQISDKIVSYFFKENKLYLYLSDDSILVFKKSDT